MIRYSLTCGVGHRFDAWFSSGDSFDEQSEAEAICCPECGGVDVRKAPMAPAVLQGRRTDAETGQTSAEDPERGQTFAFLKGLREHLQANADDVGDKFAEEARKIHYGEAESRDIVGTATTDEANALLEEGIPAFPVPKLPEEHN